MTGSAAACTRKDSFIHSGRNSDAQQQTATTSP
jgi:hypothetical protein